MEAEGGELLRVAKHIPLYGIILLLRFVTPLAGRQSRTFGELIRR